MPSIDGNTEETSASGNDLKSKLKIKLKLYEEERVKTFEQWPFDNNQKCSVEEVNFLINFSVSS